MRFGVERIAAPVHLRRVEPPVSIRVGGKGIGSEVGLLLVGEGVTVGVDRNDSEEDQLLNFFE